MNARTLVTLATFIATICFTPAGKAPPDFGLFHGAWAGFNGSRGPGATGGTLTFSISKEGNDTAAVSAAGSTISGFVVVPNLRDGGFETRPLTRGIISPKGRIRAKFKGGYFNGRFGHGEHDASGFMLVNVRRYQAVSFWYADNDDEKE